MMTVHSAMRFSLLLITAVIYITHVDVTFATTKLGIGLKQGYDYPYISDIDPRGLGAAAGFMKGDHIKDISHVPIWFVYQAEKFLKYKLNNDKPFFVMIERNGALNRIIVDKSKPMRTFPMKQGSDSLSSCFMAPNIACLEDTIDAKRPVSSMNDSRLYNYASKIDILLSIGKKQKAMNIFKNMEALFFSDSKLVDYHSHQLLRARDSLGMAPEKRHFDYIYKNTKKKISDLSGKASMFAEFGRPNYANVFYNDMIKLISQNPKNLKNKTMYVGPTLADLGKKNQILKYLKSKQFSSETRNKLLSRYTLELAKEQKEDQISDALAMIYSVKRSWTNNDYVIFVKLFQKLHMQDAAQATIKRLEKFYEKGKDNMFIQPLTARSLIEANGALGRIHSGRKYIEKHFKKRPLEMMMKLAIEAANSRSSKALALQYYKDLPKLVDEAYAKLKVVTPQERKKLSKLVVTDFYKVLAAYLPANPKYAELTPYAIDRYSYEGIIDSFIEARRFDQAMTWTKAVEAKYGKTYKYGNIYDAVGALSPSRKFDDKFKSYAPFKKNKHRYYKPHIKRLYWNGYFDAALKDFNLLNIEHKTSLILSQLPFAVTCKGCTL